MNTGSKNERLINNVIFISVLLFSLCVAEVVLRTFTPFPVNYSSNKLPDPDLAYRLSTEFHEADANGFRNPPNTGYQVMAIGDSHTYGNNVSSENSWPAVLRRETKLAIYNFGVGSYGIFSYHATLKTWRKPETRSAIIALYPGNDFVAEASSCLILKKPSPFWKMEIARLQLAWPKPTKSCEGILKEKSLSVGDWLEKNTAIVGALIAALHSKPELPKGAPRYVFPDGVLPLLVERVAEHRNSTDIEDPVVKDLLVDFEHMANDWHTLSKEGLKTGVLILPSRERVIYGYFAAHNRLNELDPQFVAQIKNQITLELRCAEILSAAGIPYRFALNEVIEAFESELSKGRSLYLPDDDGHPLEPGYAAYARVAKLLLEEMAQAAN